MRKTAKPHSFLVTRRAVRAAGRCPTQKPLWPTMGDKSQCGNTPAIVAAAQIHHFSRTSTSNFHSSAADCNYRERQYNIAKFTFTRRVQRCVILVKISRRFEHWNYRLFLRFCTSEITFFSVFETFPSYRQLYIMHCHFIVM